MCGVREARAVHLALAAGRRAGVCQAEGMVRQGPRWLMSPSELERKTLRSVWVTCVARVSPLPRSEGTPCRQSVALRGKAVRTSAAHIRRAAVRGLGTFTWGFLRHSSASVLARWKNRRDACRVSVEKPVGRGKLESVVAGDARSGLV